MSLDNKRQMIDTLRFEENALCLQARRLAALRDKLQCLSDGVLVARESLDAIDLDAKVPKFTDILVPLRTMGQRAVIECEERAVEFDGVLEQLMHCVHCLETTGNASALPSDAQQAALVVTARHLRRKPLPLATECLSTLEPLPEIVYAITEGEPEALEACLLEAVSTSHMLGLSLLLADGRTDFFLHSKQNINRNRPPVYSYIYSTLQQIQTCRAAGVDKLRDLGCFACELGGLAQR